MLRNLPPLCRYLIFALIGSAVLSLALPSVEFAYIPLFPAALRELQIWRLVTYPFFFIASPRALIGSVLNLAWAGMIIAYFGGELETIIHTKQLIFALATTVIIGGILYSLLGAEGGLGGPSILTMFFLGGFAYMWPKREISIFGIFFIKAWIVALVIFVITILPSGGFLSDASAAYLFGPIAGALGAIIYLHITYRQYSFGRSVLSRVEDIRKPKKQSTINSSMSAQQRIDMILDKITRSGIDSLSREERDFLMKNSK
jgi:membrane associated rhomboid family serine protease